MPAAARTANRGVTGTRNRLFDSGPPASPTKYRVSITGTIASRPSRHAPTTLNETTAISARTYTNDHREAPGPIWLRALSNACAPGPNNSLPHPSNACLKAIRGDRANAWTDDL